MTIDQQTEVDTTSRNQKAIVVTRAQRARDTSLAIVRSLGSIAVDLVRSIPLCLVPVAIALLLLLRPSDQQWRDWAANVAVSPNAYLKGLSCVILTLLIAYTGLSFALTGAPKRPRSTPPADQGRAVLSTAASEGR